ncbi:hypothetical protein ES707_11613 [subsurface metagenome]
MNSVQTDNSFLDTKIKLRIDNLPAGDCNVLDCYTGTGLIWKTIKERTKRRINVLGMDLKKLNGIYLHGDNLKFLASMDISKFNIIDLDAYGVPYNQLKIIFSQKLQPETIVFVTFIQSIYGGLPHGMLMDLGYNSLMIKKCPAIFFRNGFEKFKQYLAIKGIGQIKHYSHKKKHYLCFSIKKAARKD